MDDHLIIGERIKDVFEAKKMKLKDFAEAIGVARQNVYRIFEKDTIDIDLLLQISTVLEHDFIRYYTNKLSDNTSFGSVILHKRLESDSDKEIEQLKNELKLAKKEIDYLSKIIELMEERTKLLIEKNK
jgi:transcriptional regulator with XRE-family HTH domain